LSVGIFEVLLEEQLWLLCEQGEASDEKGKKRERPFHQDQGL